MAPRVTFNLIGQANTCPFIEQAQQQLVALAQSKQKLVVVTEDQPMLDTLSELLWQNANKQFIAYGIAGEPTALAAKVLLSTDFDIPTNYRKLLNLSSKMPASEHRFQEIVELVSNDKQAIAAARERYKAYRQAGFQVQHINLD